MIMKCHSHRPKAVNSDLLIAQPNVGLLRHKESPTVLPNNSFSAIENNIGEY